VSVDFVGGKDCVVDLLGTPAGYERAGVQQHFHQADHARVVNLDAGILCLPDDDRQRQSLEQGKVDMHVQALGLEGGEAVGDGEQLVAHRSEMIEAFLQSEVGKVVGADLIAQEGGELLVLFDEGIAIVSSEDMMAVFDLFEDRVQLALHPLCNAASEDFRDLVGGQSKVVCPTADITRQFLEASTLAARGASNSIPSEAKFWSD